MNNLLDFIDGLLNEGGATIDISSGHVPTTGYIVADGQHEQTFNEPTEIQVRQAVQDFVAANGMILEQEGMYLGGWVDQNTSMLHLDVSEVYSDRYLAALQGLRRGELSIYHIDSSDVIDLPQRRQTAGTGAQYDMYIDMLAREV